MSFKYQLVTLLPLSIIVVGLLGYSFMSAQWQNPTSTPPNANTAAPINIGASYQAKLGDLGAVRMRAGQYCNADGTVCTSDLSGGGGSGLGVNQTWQNFTGRRSTNVWYQNTTSSPINVYVWVSPGDGYLYANTVGSDAGQVQIAGPDNDSGTRDNLFGIIPAGHWYKQTGRGPTGWSELR
jgi:hypothetical protein